MFYKNVLISVLLVPCALTYCNNAEIQIQQLKENLYKKELELSSLARKIEEQEQIIDAMFDKMVQTMARINSSLKTEKEKEDFSKTITDFENNFDAAVLNRDVQNFIINELFCMQTDYQITTRRIKSLIIRYDIELKLLKRLFLNYEQLLQELLVLNFEVDELKKI